MLHVHRGVSGRPVPPHPAPNHLFPPRRLSASRSRPTTGLPHLHPSQAISRSAIIAYKTEQIENTVRPAAVQWRSWPPLSRRPPPWLRGTPIGRVRLARQSASSITRTYSLAAGSAREGRDRQHRETRLSRRRGGVPTSQALCFPTSAALPSPSSSPARGLGVGQQEEDGDERRRAGMPLALDAARRQHQKPFTVQVHTARGGARGSRRGACAERARSTASVAPLLPPCAAIPMSSTPR